MMDIMTKVEEYKDTPIFWDENKGQFFCLNKYFVNKLRAQRYIDDDIEDYEKMKINDD